MIDIYGICTDVYATPDRQVKNVGLHWLGSAAKKPSLGQLISDGPPCLSENVDCYFLLVIN